jgi:hypothetical protein
MSKKKQAEPIQHESCVREVAEAMKKDQWDVKADLPGFEKPAKIGEFKPDVVATKKGCLSRICQVVTEDMFEGDKQRYLEVKNYCAEYDFHFYVIDKEGKRREIDPETFKKRKN